MKNTKLTSVKVIEELYNDFKKETIGNGFNLQKLVNISVNLGKRIRSFLKTSLSKFISLKKEDVKL